MRCYSHARDSLVADETNTLFDTVGVIQEVRESHVVLEESGRRKQVGVKALRTAVEADNELQNFWGGSERTRIRKRFEGKKLIVGTGTGVGPN